MKAILFYGVRLPSQTRGSGGDIPDDYAYVFSENFPGSDWELHVRQKGHNPGRRVSTYLCLSRLGVALNDGEPFRMINPKGLQEQKMKPPERDELKDILQSLGVDYTPPKWFLTASE